MTALEQLPEDKGAYILIAEVREIRRLAVGRMGDFEIVPGFYAYVGSACGPGGLRARVAYHLESIAEPHWHIDYLLQFATPLEVWFALGDRRLEKDWAEWLAETPRFRQPIPRFGSSDYRRSRITHLFYAKRRPSFAWFAQESRSRFEPTVQPRLVSLSSATAEERVGERRRHAVNAPSIPRSRRPRSEYPP